MRTFLGKIVREAYQGNMDARTAGKLAYMLNILLGAIEASELELRLERLEARVEQQREHRAGRQRS